MKKQHIFLSHDVDWSYDGPSKEHILQRKDRFDEKLFEITPINKLYRNFSEFMEIEENMELNLLSFLEHNTKMGITKIIMMTLKN